MYDVIDTPEDYVVLAWQSLYNQARLSKNITSAINDANTKLYSKDGLPLSYNLWENPGPGETLIEPYTNGRVQPYFNPNVKRLAAYEKMDSWYDAMFHNGLKLEATAKISGGSEKLNYYTSFGYLKDEGYYTA
jgi:hypothetical protein